MSTSVMCLTRTCVMYWPVTAVFLLSIMGVAPLGGQTANQKDSIVVSADGTGDFRTIQEAVNACRDFAEQDYRIFVRCGVYKEKLIVPSWKRRITIVGEDAERTVITYDDYSGKLDAAGKKHGTFTSHTCLVAGTDIVFEDVTFENSAGPVGQAVALHVEGDRCVFRRCRFRGNQDTLFGGGETSRQFFDGCTIEGTTDFIFGPSTAVFRNCTIISKKDSYITAASTAPTRPFGFVFLRCRLQADSAGRKVYLGRPWRPYASTTFIACEMGPHILPAGWHNWNKPEAEGTARYAEYRSTGPGAHPAARVGWSRQLTDSAAALLTVEYILKGFDNWVPASAQ